jgi:hypothetical protein
MIKMRQKREKLVNSELSIVEFVLQIQVFKQLFFCFLSHGTIEDKVIISWACRIVRSIFNILEHNGAIANFSYKTMGFFVTKYTS